MSEQMDFEDGKYTVIYDEGHFKALRYGQPWRDLTGDNLVYAMLDQASQLQAERDALAAKLKEMERQEPFKLNWPEYHHNGMGCCLEDRGITDRYEAMRHGWESALKRVDEALPEVFYTRPVPAEPVNARLLEALEELVAEFGVCGLTEKARAAIAAAESAPKAVRLTDEEINVAYFDAMKQHVRPQDANEVRRVVRRAETAVLRKNGLEVSK